MPSGENSIPNQGRGRPRGAKNIATSEVKRYWHHFFSSDEYRDKAKLRILDGSAPQLETYLLALIYGKPTDSMHLLVGRLEDTEELESLTVEELTQRAQDLMLQLREAQELEAAIDVTASSIESVSPNDATPPPSGD